MVIVLSPRPSNATQTELNEMRNDRSALQLMNDITLTSDWIPVGYGTTLATKFTGVCN